MGEVHERKMYEDYGINMRKVYMKDFGVNMCLMDILYTLITIFF